MIALDTNAFLRWLAADALPPEDAPQVEAVRRLVRESDEPLWISDVVLAETVWMLKSRVGQARAEIAVYLAVILAHPRLRLEDAEAVVQAVTAYVSGGPGFADHLIGARGRRVGCRTTFTFDRGAAKLSTFTAIPL